MAGEFQALRRELSRHEAGRGRRYPVALKRRIVAWALQRRAQGASWEVLGSELGLGLETLRRWSLEKPSATTPTRALVPVHVVTRPAPSKPATTVSVSGWRVDGLSALEAAELLGALT